MSDAAFYEQNRIELSAATVESVAVDRVLSLVDQARHHGLSEEAEAEPPSGPGCGWTVRVRASSQVDELFARALTGRDRPRGRPSPVLRDAPPGRHHLLNQGTRAAGGSQERISTTTIRPSRGHTRHEMEAVVPVIISRHSKLSVSLR